MEKVTTEMEALAYCKEHQCEIKFKKELYQTPEHVIVSLNAWTKVVGKNLVEAVNRLIEMYHTPPVDHEKLEWWHEQEKFYI